ncbi:hypothetical protein [Flavilitoribacter nigricans]|uniref:8-amino-7-oxononanoate synthase n=1 Tax=Flavilitoribacter nigricans (strain ATCC 23147 / DSM 23189 / NBRC 102662 / NCIMB 1420 / SS-2) TaxID=1122177 RepID=A0A2D0NH64_FLAN2|nr:hypothetical protein [Flavilitoribacter nigricans]PHN07758.1 hypothetical protein CRP01_04760 [Flavilitoribacter nigricans DSM 23189 = NBRC 102662]
MDHNSQLVIIPETVKKGSLVTIRLIDQPDPLGDERPYQLRLGPEEFEELSPEKFTKQANANLYTWEIDTSNLEARGFTLDIVNGDDIINTGTLTVTPASNEVGVALKSTDRPRSTDLPLWIKILRSSKRLSFNNYLDYMDLLFCGPGPQENNLRSNLIRNVKNRFLPFNDTDSYRTLKAATEAFVMTNCEIDVSPTGTMDVFNEGEIDDLIEERVFNIADAPPEYNQIWNEYIVQIQQADPNNQAIKDIFTIPYLYLVRDKLNDLPLKLTAIDQILDNIEKPVYTGKSKKRVSSEASTTPRGIVQSTCKGLIVSKLNNPCFLELIWSYWHEEAMLVQVLNVITRRFQNIRGSGKNDPLAGLHIDPLQPLNNLIWGYVQDEQHRLSVVRRAYEYDHHYGFSIKGKAINDFRPADSRSRFIEAFHKLLNLCSQFYKQEDNKTIQADAFPIRNSLREVHLILAEGAHNGYGDLPSTARIEMLMQQYLLARPEFRQFIPSRNMVAYPEPWMDRVASVNKMMDWTGTSIIHFNNLAIFGEQLLLSIRFGSWSITNTSANQAAIWANFWRQAVQEYIHAYHAVTGIDLAAERTMVTDVDTRPPSYHLAKRLSEQQNGNGKPAAASGSSTRSGKTTTSTNGKVKKESW